MAEGGFDADGVRGVDAPADGQGVTQVCEAFVTASMPECVGADAFEGAGFMGWCMDTAGDVECCRELLVGDAERCGGELYLPDVVEGFGLAVRVTDVVEEVEGPLEGGNCRGGIADRLLDEVSSPGFDGELVSWFSGVR
ncbi:hypothetical protein [Polymorphospora lycopeni]|uniref:Uncharacterized protein n=1 Tax=Polymorphospora lycopeni TaxID=3140240 RepID=A0ABV5CS27_9ACTN